MVATFNTNLGRPLDLARQRLGDTDPNDALFQDETYIVLLGGEAPLGPTMAASRLAGDLAARYARKVTTDVDGQGKRWSDLHRQYAELQVRLRDEAAAEARDTAAAQAGASISEFGGGVMVRGASAREVIAAWDDEDHPDNLRRW